MDYLNTNISYQQMRRALNRPDATEEHKQALIAIDQGYQMMTEEVNIYQDKLRNSIFRLFKRKMTATTSPHQRLGIMMALNDLGIKFRVKDEENLKARMKLEKMREMKKQAIREACRKENRT